MPEIQCPVVITCPGSDDPRANFSSESADTIRFGATGWAPAPIDPSLPPTDPPIVPNGYIAAGCVSFCFSAVSQQEADDCARAQAYLCVTEPGKLIPGTPPIIVPTNNPQQCSYICPDGTGFVTTIPGGTVRALNQIEADRVALKEACEIAAHSFICLGSLQTSVCVGGAYLSSTTALGGNDPITYTIDSGTLPPGLVLSTGSDGRTLIVSGTATTAGVYAFHIKAMDVSGHTLFKLFTITVTGIDNPVLADGAIGSAYSQTLTAATMPLPLIWSIISGTLPAGLSLNSASGEISGTPTTAETKTFTVQVVDGVGLTCTKRLSITVAPAGCPSLLTTVVLPNHTSTGNYFVVYGATGDLIHPNEYFVSQLAAVGIVDADTNTYVTTVALPVGFNHLSFGGAQVGGGGLHFQAQDAFFDNYALRMDLITHAWTQSAIYVGGGLQYASYDATHAQVGYLDGGQFGVSQPKLWILNDITLVQVSLFNIGVINEIGRGMCYSQARDVYYFIGDTGGVAPFFLRGIRRSDGAQVLNVALPNAPTAVAYLSTTDKIYLRTVGVSPLHYFVVVNAATGVIESTTTLNPAAAIAGVGIEYWSSRDAFWLLGSAGGALQQNAILFSRQTLTEICTIPAAAYRAGIYGAKSAVRRPVWPIGYQDMDIYQ